jgi:hypothetical protein
MATPNQPWIISRRPINGAWAVRIRENNTHLGTVEPLGADRGYKATRQDGTTKTEHLLFYACHWLYVGHPQSQRDYVDTVVDVTGRGGL